MVTLVSKFRPIKAIYKQEVCHEFKIGGHAVCTIKFHAFCRSREITFKNIGDAVV